MPEGPAILMLREEADRFRGKIVRRASGNAKLDLTRLEGKRVKAVRTWGKHFLLEFSGFSVRVHLLLFGSYRIDDPKDTTPRLALEFDNGQLIFYAISVKFIEGDLDDAYDWTADVLSESWSAANAKKKLRVKPDMLACDALLDQDIFAGVGVSFFRFCFKSLMPAQGSFFILASRAGTFFMVNAAALETRESSFHESGTATGAPTRARRE